MCPTKKTELNQFKLLILTIVNMYFLLLLNELHLGLPFNIQLLKDQYNMADGGSVALIH